MNISNQEEITLKKSKVKLHNIKKVIAVISGKGGVGKSTIASLLSRKLSLCKKDIGLLDADIYGPSIPQIFNIKEKLLTKDGKMVPIKINEIFINSIGLIVDELSAISWRGPMVSKVLYQLLSMTLWPSLDYLIIDMPPGTGDIHLSLLSNYHIDGIIIVTGPQKISVIDVERTINLYKKFSIHMIGIIENMSFYKKNEIESGDVIFYGNGGEFLANKHNIPLICKIPIIPYLSEISDRGGDLKQFSDVMDNILPHL